jgi:hypothetical protein
MPRVLARDGGEGESFIIRIPPYNAKIFKTDLLLVFKL